LWTELIIFGNARGGTPPMQTEQLVGIDLPLKVLVWQDAAGTTWLSYNDPSWIVNWHEIANAAPIAHNLSALLLLMSRSAAGLQLPSTASRSGL
jgi:hypothetical protein